MLRRTLNRSQMSMKKTPKSGCDMFLGVRNRSQKNQIWAHPSMIFSNCKILAIFAVFCNFRAWFRIFSANKVKIRVCREKLMQIDIDPRNVKIGPLEPIFQNRSNQLFGELENRLHWKIGYLSSGISPTFFVLIRLLEFRLLVHWNLGYTFFQHWNFVYM